ADLGPAGARTLAAGATDKLVPNETETPRINDKSHCQRNRDFNIAAIVRRKRDVLRRDIQSLFGLNKIENVIRAINLWIYCCGYRRICLQKLIYCLLDAINGNFGCHLWGGVDSEIFCR